MTGPRAATRLAAVVVAVAVVAGAAGWLAGRSTVPDCTQVRDEHRVAALEIASRAQVDPATIEAEPVARTHDLVQRRPDCFSSFEREEARNLYRLHGPDAP